ncbi:MAG: hypothetical protein K1X88_36010 [Nannocystaceae bacterium]|nr:hypothetical protein [Nannocystaceae bacterium]
MLDRPELALALLRLEDQLFASSRGELPRRAAAYALHHIAMPAPARRTAVPRAPLSGTRAQGNAASSATARARWSAFAVG